MALQTSGQISLNNLQTQFGGTNPINFSEYYLNAATGYATGVSGIPNIGTQISLSQFYGKAKTVFVFPPAQQTVQSNLGMPQVTGNGYFLHVTGASGTNLTTPGGSTFNNIRSSNRNSPAFINHQTLILQARRGDRIKIQIERWTADNYYTYNTFYLNIGSGWFIVLWWRGPGGLNSFYTYDYNYTIPTNLAPGNYGIAAVTNYSDLSNTGYTTTRFYSLHVVA